MGWRDWRHYKWVKIMIWNCVIVKGEEDIIDQWYEQASKKFDRLVVLYNGNVTDESYQKLVEHSFWSGNRLLLFSNDDVFSCGLRKFFIDLAGSVHPENRPDWIYFLAPDLWVEGNPREHVKWAEEKGCTLINYEMIQFYPTKGELDRKINFTELKFYRCNWEYIAAYKFSRDIRWETPDQEPPVHPNPIIYREKRLFLKHYQFRSKEQIKRRLQIRRDVKKKGCGSFNHYLSWSEEDYVFEPSVLKVYGEEIEPLDKSNTLGSLIERSRKIREGRNKW